MPVADLSTLIVSPDAKISSALSLAFHRLKVVLQVCADHPSASQRVAEDKFEAVVLDLDSILETVPFVRSLRASAANRNAVVLAVASNDSAKRRAHEHGVAFVIERPITVEGMQSVLQSAYGFMLQDRRRYFRLVMELPVSIRTVSGVELPCKPINISPEGMALRILLPMPFGETVSAVFSIPNPGPLIIARGTVTWDDKHGKAGMHLHFASSRDKDRVSEWLESEFYMQRNVELWL